MKRFDRPALISAAFLLLVFAPALRAQKLTAANAQAVTIEDRRKALNAVFHDYWEDEMEHNPEFASSIGDKRYNDKVSDYSVSAVNAAWSAEQNFLMRLAAIDPAGFTDAGEGQPRTAPAPLADDQEAADFKEWEMPVNQMGGIYDTYPQLCRSSALPR